MLQWWKAWIPSNSLACLYGLSLDLAEKKALGEDVEIVINAYDEMNIVVPFEEIVRRIGRADGRGLVCLTGVQSNQYPRALDIARQFREVGVQVAIGGFHVSGCLSMLPGVQESLQEALDMGITLVAGEVEQHLGEIYTAACDKELKPLYNYLNVLPSLEGAVTPFLPERLVRRYGLPKENPLVFFPRRIWETLSTYARFGWYAWSLHRLRKRVQRDPAAKTYTDLALAPVAVAEEEELEMFHLNESAEAAVAKARAQAEARAKAKARKTPVAAAE